MENDITVELTPNTLQAMQTVGKVLFTAENLYPVVKAIMTRRNPMQDTIALAVMINKGIAGPVTLPRFFSAVASVAGLEFASKVLAELYRADKIAFRKGMFYELACGIIAAILEQNRLKQCVIDCGTQQPIVSPNASSLEVLSLVVISSISDYLDDVCEGESRIDAMLLVPSRFSKSLEMLQEGLRMARLDVTDNRLLVKLRKCIVVGMGVNSPQALRMAVIDFPSVLGNDITDIDKLMPVQTSAGLSGLYANLPDCGWRGNYAYDYLRNTFRLLGAKVGYSVLTRKALNSDVKTPKAFSHFLQLLYDRVPHRLVLNLAQFREMTKMVEFLAGASLAVKYGGVHVFHRYPFRTVLPTCGWAEEDVEVITRFGDYIYKPAYPPSPLQKSRDGRVTDESKSSLQKTT